MKAGNLWQIYVPYTSYSLWFVSFLPDMPNLHDQKPEICQIAYTELEDIFFYLWPRKQDGAELAEWLSYKTV